MQLLQKFLVRNLTLKIRYVIFFPLRKSQHKLYLTPSQLKSLRNCDMMSIAASSQTLFQLEPRCSWSPFTLRLCLPTDPLPGARFDVFWLLREHWKCVHDGATLYQLQYLHFPNVTLRLKLTRSTAVLDVLNRSTLCLLIFVVRVRV